MNEEPVYIRRDEVVASLRKWAEEEDSDGTYFIQKGYDGEAERKFARSSAFTDAADAFERGGE